MHDDGEPSRSTASWGGSGSIKGSSNYSTIMLYCNAGSSRPLEISVVTYARPTRYRSYRSIGGL